MLTPTGQLPAILEHVPITAAREAELRRLLDPPMTDHQGNQISYYNFDYARDSGLIDEFAYDPAEGYDGLMHVLTGNVHNQQGRRSVGGFHINHDPDYVGTVYGSYEDNGQVKEMTSKHRRQYVVRPFEPRKSRVVVGGFEKTEVTHDKNGIPRVAVVGSTMFPKEYDPITAMQAIRIAKQTRDRSLDEPKGSKIIARGAAPMIDGRTQMEIFLVLTPDEKVITAYPRVKEAGYMKLSDLAIKQALGLEEENRG